MTNLFDSLNKDIIKYDFAYTTPDNHTYNISEMHPQFYYNEHYQK